MTVTHDDDVQITGKLDVDGWIATDTGLVSVGNLVVTCGTLSVVDGDLLMETSSENSRKFRMEGEDEEVFERYVEHVEENNDTLIEKAPFTGCTVAWRFRDANDGQAVDLYADGTAVFAGGVTVTNAFYAMSDIHLVRDMFLGRVLKYNGVGGVELSFPDDQTLQVDLDGTTAAHAFQVGAGGIAVFKARGDGTMFVYGNIISHDGDIYLADGHFVGGGAGEPRIVFDETNDDMALLDAKVGIGTSSPEALFHVVDESMYPVRIERAYNAALGPCLDLVANRGAAGQDGDTLGYVRFRGYNDAGTPEEIVYSEVVAGIIDASDGTEDSSLLLRLRRGGSLISKMSLGPSYVVFNHGTEDLAIIDSGSVDATEQDWVQVMVGGNTGYLRVFASK